MNINDKIDEMGVILKEIMTRLDPEEHARSRAYWKAHGYLQGRLSVFPSLVSIFRSMMKC